jgi:Cu+-exporting ATPase
MKQNAVAGQLLCYHCGNECLDDIDIFEEKPFCCTGCKSVYQVLNANNLCNYYSYNDHPGANRASVNARFDYLDDPEIISDLIGYTDENITVVTFYIPEIHCSSCIWLLERLNKLNQAIHYSQVNFLKKQITIRYSNLGTSLRQVVDLLHNIGYTPLISFQDVVKKQDTSEKDYLVQKIAVAGFCFGNVMLLSFPEYFGLSGLENTLKHFFGLLNIMFSLPVVFYSGRGYFISAWNNLRNKVLNIDFPLALGIGVLFIRTVTEVYTRTGAGFADTLCGLVFFLLVGKFVQKKTYHHISFERDYRSFFPVAVQVIENHIEKPLPLSQLQTGHRIVIRHNEIIPADAILLKGQAMIDFSFVTGEAAPVSKTLGEIIYAGGRQTGQAIEMEVVKAVSQSYLTQLWNNEAFTRKGNNLIPTFTQTISKYFTVVLLLIAFSALFFWLPTDYKRGIAAFTAVLIVACPCALALSTPFAMSAALSIFDRNFFYLKNTAVVEQLAKINTIVLDKTGTITSGESKSVNMVGNVSAREKQLIYSVCINSAHPLSRTICKYLGSQRKLHLTNYSEVPGQGIIASIGEDKLRIGNSRMVLGIQTSQDQTTSVHLLINEAHIGYFEFSHQYRIGLADIAALSPAYKLFLLSGDQDGERFELINFFKRQDAMLFNQSPQQKLDFISNLQGSGSKVMMIGDGLNDAGVNNFSPGSDAILDGRSLNKLPAFLLFSKDTVRIIHISFLISLTYNITGLTYAITGNLSPLIAAILMPLSTATIISFTSIATHVAAKNRKLS